MEVININEKKYYNQEYLSKEISELTGYPINEVSKILNTISDVIAKKISQTLDTTEIKITNGIIVGGKYETFKSNLSLEDEEKIIMKARLTKQYKQKINKLHKEICNINN